MIFCVFALIATGFVGLTTVFSQSSVSSKVESVTNRSISFAATPSTPKAFVPPSPAARKMPNSYQPAPPESIPTPTNGVAGLARITATCGRETMCGAATIPDSSGIIAMNYHVANHPSPTFPIYTPEKGSTHFARLIGYSLLADAAILKVDGLPSLTPITPIAKPPASGDLTVMFGFPDPESRTTVASGHVRTGIARNRGMMMINSFTCNGMSFLVSCHMAPGYSGGPTANPKTGQALGTNARRYVNSKVQAESIMISDVMRMKIGVPGGKPTKDTVIR